MGYNIELSYDMIDNIIISELTEQRDLLRNNLNLVLDSDEGFVFSSDPVEDIHQISNLIKSINNVLKYYSVPNHD